MLEIVNILDKGCWLLKVSDHANETGREFLVRAHKEGEGDLDIAVKDEAAILVDERNNSKRTLTHQTSHLFTKPRKL